MDVHQVETAADQNSYPHDQMGRENNLNLLTVKPIPVLGDGRRTISLIYLLLALRLYKGCLPRCKLIFPCTEPLKNTFTPRHSCSFVLL